MLDRARVPARRARAWSISESLLSPAQGATSSHTPHAIRQQWLLHEPAVCLGASVSQCSSAATIESPISLCSSATRCVQVSSASLSNAEAAQRAATNTDHTTAAAADSGTNELPGSLASMLASATAPSRQQAQPVRSQPAAGGADAAAAGKSAPLIQELEETTVCSPDDRIGSRPTNTSPRRPCTRVSGGEGLTWSAEKDAHALVVRLQSTDQVDCSLANIVAGVGSDANMTVNVPACSALVVSEPGYAYTHARAKYSKRLRTLSVTCPAVSKTA